MTDAELTVAAVHAKGWECVRLGPQSKKPDGPRWQVTNDPDAVAAWFHRGANVGLVCHERTGVAVLDPDEMLPWAEMIDELGHPSLPWVITGSGKLHYYIAWTPHLPAKLIDFNNEKIGEIQRGPGMQQVVLPGSIHPNGRPYRWISESLGDLVMPINPIADPLPRLAGIWNAYLTAFTFEAEAGL